MIISLLSLLNIAHAVPLQMTQQGRVLDNNGAAVTGTNDLTFRIYDSSTGGSVYWSEALTVNFTNGYYAAVLGADEQNNPLDSSTLSLYPLFLEVQLNNNTPMSTRYAINSAPYAQMAGNAEVAESVSGGVVNASEVQVNNYQVIDASGNWVGQPITVDWNNIDPNTIPSYIADGDDDTLASLSCAVGEIAGWTGASWGCVSDATLSVSDLQTMLSGNSVDLNNASTIGGLQILTVVDDSDTLGDLSCVNDGEIARYDLLLNQWYCDTDGDTLATLNCQDGESATYDAANGVWVCTAASSGGSGSVANGFQTIAPANGTTVNTGLGAPATILQGLIDDGNYIEHIQPSPRVSCTECGTGADGSYSPGTFSPQLVLSSGEYNFTDFTLPAGVTLTSPGTSPLIIRATGTVTISGILDLRGENGNTAGQGIGGSSGGASGTDGQNGSNSWGGSGSDGQGGSTNVSLASTDVTSISGGTGGQGGRSGSSVYVGSGGGGGGGAVAIVANSIVVDGSILVGGGARGTTHQSSGHGGSGVIWLRGSEVSITGSIDATSYCTQCEGEIRIDARNIDYPSTDYAAGIYRDLPSVYALYQDSTGVISFDNNSTNAVNVDIRYIP